MKISLITVSFNSVGTIRDTLESVRAQTHPDIEYIVVDGGSRDGTREVVAQYADCVTRFLSEPDTGIYSAMNKGVQLATGEVIGFINSDDYFADTDTVASINSVFEGTGADCVFGDLDYVDPIRTGKVVRVWRSGPYEPRSFWRGWHPAHPTFYARRSLFAKCGGFDEQFRISADYELMLRFLEVAKARSEYLPKTLVKMRDGGQSNRNLRNILKANIECYRAFRKNGLPVTPLSILRKPLAKVGQLFAVSGDGRAGS